MHQAQIPQLDKSNPAETVTFNGVTYRLMGTRKYYLSQSTTNEGRKAPKGLHVAIWEFFSGKTVPQGFHIHHKDGNTFNNEFSNLECLSRSEHCKKTNYKTERVKKHLDKVRPLASAWHRSEEGRSWHRQHAKERLPTFYQCVCSLCGSIFEAKSPNGRFCSRKCETQYRWNYECYSVTKKCEICGQEFTSIEGGGRKPRTTCSRACSRKLGWNRARLQPVCE